MVHVHITVPATPEQIFAVLADGWLFSSWMVGATRVRAVDDSWPAVGSRLRYSVGLWPFTRDDSAEVVFCTPPDRIELEARLRPLGPTTIHLGIVPTAAGETQIRMYENTKGWIATRLPEGLRELLLAPRNRESLSRLADLVASRARRTGADSGPAHPGA